MALFEQSACDSREHVLTYFTGFLTFILGFFNSIVFARWWKMRELCGEIIKQNQTLTLNVTSLVIPVSPHTQAIRCMLQIIFLQFGVFWADFGWCILGLLWSAKRGMYWSIFGATLVDFVAFRSIFDTVGCACLQSDLTNEAQCIEATRVRSVSI